MTALLIPLGLSLGIQAFFFVFAAGFRSDKVTDLSYSLSFIALTGYLLLGAGTTGPAQVLLALMIVFWAVRLAAYLVRRILLMGRDPRFDKTRGNFPRFLAFWAIQGLFVWVLMLPVTIWFTWQVPESLGPVHWLGFTIWAVGLSLESIADAQKFAHKRKSNQVQGWVAHGLWRWSRHPNYFGEMILWWGIFLFTAADLGGWSWLGAIGPVALTGLLRFGTGIPQLEKSAQRKWGHDPAYRHYVAATNLLIPGPPGR
jgi:steroid 5-alpha reductase family enzyme